MSSYTARHFTPATDPQLFRCPCGRSMCDAPPPTDRLLEVLDAIRDQYGRPITVDSGPRCAFRNKQKGGEDPSAHLLGEAADLVCILSTDRFDLYNAARACGVVRLGIGSTFLHVDVTHDARFAQAVTWTYYGIRRTA